MRKSRQIHGALISLLALSPWATPSQACTTFLLQAPGNPIVAKNLDWDTGQGLLLINKRHVAKEAALVPRNAALRWTSTLMSLTVTQSGRDFPWEGMNEAGLSVHSLELMGSSPPPSNDPRPAVGFVQWMQYILDTSSTLPDAIRNAESVRVGTRIPIHYFVCDGQARCASFEYFRGRLEVHSSTQGSLPYPALANTAYKPSVAYLDRQLKTAGMPAILKGTSPRSLDRFARAALWPLAYTPGQDRIGFALAGLDNVAEAAPDLRTYWSMVFSLGARVLSLKTYSAPRIKTIRLPAFDPDCRSGTEMLDVNAEIDGDATGRFVPWSPARNRELAEADTSATFEEREVMGGYPEAFTLCTTN